MIQCIKFKKDKKTKSTIGNFTGTYNECKKYTFSSYKKCIEELKDRIKNEGGVLGEFEQSENNLISLPRVSHIIDKIDIDEHGNIKGQLRILDTFYGKITNTLIDNNYNMSLSMRCICREKKDGDYEVYHIITFDLLPTQH